MAKLKLKKQRRLRLNQSSGISNKVVIVVAIALAVILAVGSVVTFIILPLFQSNDTDIHGIQVKQLPKTSYFVGEVASYDGLIVEAVLHNGEKQEINLDECTITGFSTKNVTDSQTVTIRYKGFTCTYHISVKELPKEYGSLTSIEMKSLPNKLTYTLDEWIDPTGGVILCKYSDGTTKEVDLLYSHIKTYGPTEPGEYVITVIYEDEAGRASTTFTVTITE